MMTQTTTATPNENILLFLPTTDAERIISSSFLSTEKHLHEGGPGQYPQSVISLVDKFPTAGSYIWVQNPSLSESNSFEKTRHGKIFKITILPTKTLKEPIQAILEPDDEGYIIRTIDLPLYGYGDDAIEAIENLKYEIESVYDDLMEDENFSDEWLRYKRYLSRIICSD